MTTNFNDNMNFLIKNWFFNLNNNVINESILVMIYSGKLEDLVSFDFKIKMNLSVYYSIPFLNYSKLNTDQKNKIIIVDPTKLDSIKLELVNKKMLIIESNHDFFKNIQEYKNPQIYNELNIDENELNSYYLEKVNISEIFQNLQTFNLSHEISIRLHLLTKIYPNIEYLLIQNLSIKTLYKNENFKSDIEMLYKHKVLTSRLAVIIYRIFTLEIDSNVTAIGRNIFNLTGCKSKSFTAKMIFNLSNHKEITISQDLFKKKVFKAYDLNVNHMELKIRTEIAMELLSYNIKDLTIDVIAKSTKLPIETVKKLNSNFI